MPLTPSKWKPLASAPRPEKVLERYYPQLREWAVVLTRGDRTRSEDIVHDLYLYVALTKPDFSRVENLDNYLYQSLRHMYLSALVRASREAMQSFTVADFDSVQVALWVKPNRDTVQQQNDLRRICCYAMWRKPRMRAASYFILRFFHGYRIQEIADIACVPLDAIQRRLSEARAEVWVYLAEPDKTQPALLAAPPEPVQCWSPVYSQSLVQELRASILSGRTGKCLSDGELQAHYRSVSPKPVSTSRLSHIVSCEECLARIDGIGRRPTLKDREPLDGIDGFDGNGGNGEDRAKSISGHHALLRRVQKHCDDVYDHRPQTLSIAVDGKIVALHEVQAQRNMQSARIERADKSSFVEVFSEQGLRIAMLSLDELPPNGPHEQVQRTALSDERWIELTLTIDGQGLNAAVTYVDPALALDTAEENDLDIPLLRDAEQSSKSVLPWSRSRRLFAALVGRMLRASMSNLVLGWAIVLVCVFSTAGYFVYRYESHPPALNASVILRQSVQFEQASLENQTEHEVLRMEIADANGAVRQHGTIDLWKDGSGARYMRRLYDDQHRLIAAEWRQHNGRQGQYLRSGRGNSSQTDAQLLQENLWKRDISSSAFSESEGRNVQMLVLADGYELSAEGASSFEPHLISATLVLDHHLHPVREIMRVRTEAGVREVRLLEADYERRPSFSVPDAIFDPQDQGIRSSVERRRLIAPNGAATDIQLSELHVAVLFQLSNLGADATEQIEVKQTQNGRIQVSGIVADDARKMAILSNLNLLKDSQPLEIRLDTPRDLQSHPSAASQIAPESMNVYEMRESKAPTDALVRKHFQAQGLSGKALDSAVVAFSREALEHAQSSLQHASALERLGNSFTATELASMNFASQQQWTEMVAKHATALEVELRALQEQLAQISPVHGPIAQTGNSLTAIETPAQFMRAAAQVLRDTQAMNREIGSTFTAYQAEGAYPAAESALESARNAIPIQEVVEVTSFAVQLNTSARTAQMNQQKSGVAKPLL